MPEEGLEPTPTCVDWILNPARVRPKSKVSKELRDDAAGVVPTMVPCPRHGTICLAFPPDLARLVGARNSLSIATTSAVLIQRWWGTQPPDQPEPPAHDAHVWPCRVRLAQVGHRPALRPGRHVGPTSAIGTSPPLARGDGGGNSRHWGHSLFCLSEFFVRSRGV